jgi:hypothetical protein
MFGAALLLYVAARFRVPRIVLQPALARSRFKGRFCYDLDDEPSGEK